MKQQPLAIAVLRWAVGLVVLLEALHLAWSPAEAIHVARNGLPAWIRPALAWPESAAAVLFLVPRTTLAGGSALLPIFAAAMAIHLHLRDYRIGALVVYAAAVVVCMAHRRQNAGSQTLCT